jgi:hypothetical protein
MPERTCVGCKSQVEWGCKGSKYREPEPGEDPRNAWINPAEISVNVEEQEEFACPRQHLHENPAYWRPVFLYYGMFQKGFLPQAGSVIDQANKAMEVFQILAEVNAECDAEIRKRETRKKGDPSARGR